MKNLSYCVDCRRIDFLNEICSYCQSTDIKDINRKTPVNIIGTKIKGRVLNVKDEMVDVLCYGQGKANTIKQFKAEELRKIL